MRYLSNGEMAQRFRQNKIITNTARPRPCLFCGKMIAIGEEHYAGVNGYIAHADCAKQALKQYRKSQIERDFL